MSLGVKARLREVKEGKGYFDAASDQEQDIGAFQSVVYELGELFKGGFLEKYEPQRKAIQVMIGSTVWRGKTDG